MQLLEIVYDKNGKDEDNGEDTWKANGKWSRRKHRKKRLEDRKKEDRSWIIIKAYFPEGYVFRFSSTNDCTRVETNLNGPDFVASFLFRFSVLALLRLWFYRPTSFPFLLLSFLFFSFFAKFSCDSKFIFSKFIYLINDSKREWNVYRSCTLLVTGLLVCLAFIEKHFIVNCHLIWMDGARSKKLQDEFSRSVWTLGCLCFFLPRNVSIELNGSGIPYLPTRCTGAYKLFNPLLISRIKFEGLSRSETLSVWLHSCCAIFVSGQVC